MTPDKVYIHVIDRLFQSKTVFQFRVALFVRSLSTIMSVAWIHFVDFVGSLALDHKSLHATFCSPDSVVKLALRARLTALIDVTDRQ